MAFRPLACVLGVALLAASSTTERTLASHVDRARAAAVGNRFLVAWTAGGVGGRTIDATSGEPGPALTLVSGTANLEALASDGTQFLLGWTQGRPRDLRISRVSPEGTLLDPSGVVLAPATDGDLALHPSQLVLCWNGTEWLALWVQSPYEEAHLVATRLDADLTPIGSVDLSGMGRSANALVTWTGSRWFIVYDDLDTDMTDFVTIAPDGSQLSRGTHGRGYESLTAVPGAVIATELRADGAIWQLELDPETGERREWTAERLSQPLAPGYPRVHSSLGSADERPWALHEEPGTFEPDVVFDGATVFASAWSPKLAVSGRRGLAIATRGWDLVDRTFTIGEPIESETPYPTPTPIATPPPLSVTLDPEKVVADGWSSRIAASADQFLVISGIGRYSAPPEWQILDRSGTARVGPTPLPDDALDPTAASDGANFVIVWRRVRSVDPDTDEAMIDLFAMRVTGRGDVLDPGGIPISSGTGWPTWDEPDHPTIAWDGSSWVIGWQLIGGGIRAVRMTSDGVVLDDPPLEVDDFGLAPAAVWTSGMTRLLFFDGGEPVTAGIMPSGAVQPATFAASNVDDAVMRLATDGRRDLLLYTCGYRCRPDDPPSGIIQTRTWAVELDGANGSAFEATPVTPGASIAVWAGRWVFGREDGGNVLLDGTTLFENASGPNLAMAGADGLAVGARDSNTIVRAFHFGAIDPPAVTPTPAPTWTPLPAPTSTPAASPSPTPASGGAHGGSACSVTEAASSPLALLPIALALLVMFRIRSRRAGAF